MVEAGKKIRVAILEDHQSIVDGYRYRLGLNPEIEVTGVAKYGDELDALLENADVDVLFLDVSVKTSETNSALYPIFHYLSKFTRLYPELSILIISMDGDSVAMINKLMKAGARGYIIKDETGVIEQLANVVVSVANGNNYVSQRVYDLINGTGSVTPDLTPRQLEALSLCAAHPDWLQADVAKAMVIAPATVRNLLSGAYFRLSVNTKSAAVQKAQELGLLAKKVPLIE